MKFPVFGRSGEVSGVGSFATDISAQKVAEERLRQAQKMEAIGQLTGGVAHDFNNLLAVIMGNADLLDRLLDEGDPRKIRAVDFILKASRRGAELTQRLLAFSRKQILDPKPIDLGDLLPGMIAMLGRTLGETIDIRLVEAADLGTCEADPGQLENALLNMMSQRLPRPMPQRVSRSRASADTWPSDLASASRATSARSSRNA